MTPLAQLTTRPFNVLLVEDNADDIELAKIAFQGAAFTDVHVERDGQAALDYLLLREKHAKGRDRVHLVLLDLHLPKLNGIEVLKAIRASEKLVALPTIILSASGLEEDIQAAYENGANSYVQKPVEFDEFRKAVVVLSHYWGALVQLPRAA